MMADDYAKFLPYARKQIRKWEAKRWENDILYSAAKKKEGEFMKPTVKSFLALAEDKSKLFTLPVINRIPPMVTAMKKSFVVRRRMSWNAMQMRK